MTTDPRPEPVLDAAKLAGAIAAVIVAVGIALRLAGLADVVDEDLARIAEAASNAVLGAATAWALVGPWITARLKARDKVTPLTDPRDARGVELLPVDEVAVLDPASYPPPPGADDEPGRHAIDRV